MKNTLKFIGGTTLFVVSLHASASDYEVITVHGSATHMQDVTPLDSQRDISPDFTDTLNAINGISVNHNGPVTGVLQYRGLIGDHIPVLFDGVGIAGAGPNAMDSPISHIMATSNTQVNIYKGVAPVIAGPETLTASVDITQNIDWDSFSNTQLFWRGTDNGKAQYIRAQHEEITEDIYLSGTGFYQTSDHSENGNSAQRSQSFYKRYGGQGQFGLKQDNGEWLGSFQHQYTGPSGTAALNMDINYIAATWARLSYTWEAPANAEVKMTLYGNRNTHDMDNFSLREISEPMAKRLNSVDSQLQGVKASWTNATWQAGLQWQTQAHNSLITNPNSENFAIVNFNDVQRSRTNAFIHYTTTDSVQSFSFGVQPTQVKMHADNVSHHMQQNQVSIAKLVNDFNTADKALSWQFIDWVGNYKRVLNPNLDWFFDVGLKHKAPAYTQVYVWFPLGISGGLADGNNYIGELALKHETAKSINTGLLWETPALTIQAQIYLSDIDDYITGTPSTNEAVNMLSMMMSNKTPLQWSNVNSQLYGMEIDLSYQISQQQNLALKASISRGRNMDNSTELFRIAPAKLYAIWQIEHERWTYRIKQTLVQSQDNISLLNNETPSTGYAVTDVISTYRAATGLTVTIGVNNVFAKNYQDHLAGINRVGGAEPISERLSALGRTFSIGIGYQF